MTDATSPERHATDEPGGTTAHEASLRPPGSSVSPGSADDGSPAEPAGTDHFDEPQADDTAAAEVSRAGYDADSVSGDTDAYRPQ